MEWSFGLVYGVGVVKGVCGFWREGDRDKVMGWFLDRWVQLEV